ncbi:LPS export ABC transporter periplasmic protein LptC [Phytopseudomonas dryadis]|uniref:Lipopolysaccharide export system protein LptC n=1 Tax=Phytopseudomonas dryadis TaxID=2487520 RepID=A0A4V2KBW0_9GAMM|nr:MULTISPECIES: LPS export ABC transporter periplasmic protein LptC [Pseudomonas]TBU89474.1 LPS export ABC transporter periplasmic protein LptC [Pseudomonas dryadis]TBV04105.1 LPS export ABC transporter periplasmic protein LptC [Pseudomonas dryadis]TBV17003.1 LPS export ABC transporter periplasmic protein LptC [Pseudomonas sp. FRB 230]
MLRKLLTPVLLTFAALLLVAAGYWNINPDSFSSPPSQTRNENPVDFYAVNARSVQYQADGKLQYDMTSSLLEHVQSSDITLLSDPRMNLYRGTEQPWKVRSERAEVGPDGIEVELIDQVRVERTDAKGRPTILTTSRLTVFPQKEYAQTQQAVRIDAANGVTTAQGMKAYLNDGRMLLQSNVRGQHEVR